jgi:hypothetical protein
MHFLRRNFEPVAIAAICLAMGLVLGACSDADGDGSEGGIQTQESGRLLVQPPSIAFAQVELGQTVTEDVTITNIHGSESLSLFDITLKARDGGTAEDLELLNKPADDFELGANQSVTLQIAYTATGRANAAQLEIISSDPNYTREEPFTLNIDTQANSPEIAVSPEVVRFPRLPAGQSQERTLYIRNFGSAPLIIYDVGYSGGSEFSIDPVAGSQIVLDPYELALAEQNPERYELAVKVHYAADGSGGAGGEIRIESNDPSGQSDESGRGIKIVDVQANAQSPCILVNGTTRNFGPVPIGAVYPDVVSMTNCGSQPLVVSGIEITANSADDEFSLDLGEWAVDSTGSLGAEITIIPGARETFQVNYGPLQVGSDTGTVLITSNDPAQPELELDLVGRGSDGLCPVATVGAKVRGVSSAPRATISAAPLDYIVLDGSASTDPDGQVLNYEWTVLEVPEGTNIELGPASGDINDSDQSKREFRALLAGTYKFGLEVVDNEGFRSCNQAVATVVAIPNEQIHIELTWTNPEDFDETDENGSDLDLHLVKMGPGTWFESPYDVYFRNTNSSGGGIWNPGSPSLDIDDTDGLGPENIQFDDPVNCQWYAVGVHYYRQAFGTAYATIRIYINEQPVFEIPIRALEVGNHFWDVARIHWNQGATPGFHVYPVDEIIPAKPAGQAPAVTESMINSGLCTAQGLY